MLDVKILSSEKWKDHLAMQCSRRERWPALVVDEIGMANHCLSSGGES